MGFAVEYGLIEMRDAPAQRYVVDKELGELFGRRSGVGVAPCAEGHEYLLVFAKRHVAVHHCTDADGGESLYLDLIAVQHVFAQMGVAVLQTIEDGFGAVGPHSVGELVFPVVHARGYGAVVLVDEHRLDACRAKLDAEHGFAVCDCSLSVHVTLRDRAIC